MHNDNDSQTFLVKSSRGAETTCQSVPPDIVSIQMKWACTSACKRDVVTNLCLCVRVCARGAVRCGACACACGERGEERRERERVRVGVGVRREGVGTGGGRWVGWVGVGWGGVGWGGVGWGGWGERVGEGGGGRGEEVVVVVQMIQETACLSRRELIQRQHKVLQEAESVRDLTCTDRSLVSDKLVNQPLYEEKGKEANHPQSSSLEDHPQKTVLA